MLRSDPAVGNSNPYHRISIGEGARRIAGTQVFRYVAAWVVFFLQWRARLVVLACTRTSYDFIGIALYQAWKINRRVHWTSADPINCGRAATAT